MQTGLRLLAAGSALTLLMFACGDDGAAAPTTTTAAATTTTTTTTTLARQETTAVPTSTGPGSTTTTTTSATTTIAPAETTTAVTSATTTGATRFRVATADDPLLVWVIGDSLVWTLGYATRDLAEATEAAEVVIDNQGGSGLVRPDFFHWPIFVSERMPEVQPGVVVVHIGANDGQAIRAPDADLETGSPEWIEHYNRSVGEFMDLLAFACEHVYWLGPPAMRGETFSGRMRMIGDLHAAQAELRPKVTYLDAHSLFVDESGVYADELPDASGHLVQMRQEDGVHYTWEGGYHLARAVVELIAADWGFAALLGE